MTDDESSVGAEPTDRYVEYCLGSVSSNRLAELRSLSEQTREATCLDRCGTCYRTEFAVVDGELLRGEVLDRFLDRTAEDGWR